MFSVISFFYNGRTIDRFENNFSRLKMNVKLITSKTFAVQEIHFSNAQPLDSSDEGYDW